MMKLPLNDIKIIIFDIGKTIFDKEKQEVVSENLINLLVGLKAKGIKIGTCTMRTIKSCKELLGIDLDFYISLNGSYVQCDDKTLINLRIKNNFENCLTYGKSRTYFSNTYVYDQAKINGFLAKNKGCLIKPYVITLFNVDENQINKYKNEYSISYWTKTKTLSLQSKECSKVLAIKKILNLYKIKEDKMIYFGDGPNDLDVFKSFTNTIMMKNGYHDLRKYSFDICDTCSNDGVYKFLLNNCVF